MNQLPSFQNSFNQFLNSNISNDWVKQVDNLVEFLNQNCVKGDPQLLNRVIDIFHQAFLERTEQSTSTPTTNNRFSMLPEGDDRLSSIAQSSLRKLTSSLSKISKQISDPSIEGLLVEIESIQHQIETRANIPQQTNVAESKEPLVLLAAAQSGNVDQVKTLISSQQANINVLDDRKATPLMWAAYSGNTAIVELLIEAGAEINYCSPEDGSSAILLAALAGHSKIMKLLVEKGANVNVKDIKETTPLMYVVKKGDHATAKMLLEHGANPDAQNENGRTALMIAVDQKDHTTVQMLLEHGANPAAQDEQGGTALMIAVNQKDHTTVQMLLEHGANPAAQDENGRTALTGAAFLGAKELELLLAGKASQQDLLRNKEALRSVSVAHAAKLSGRCELLAPSTEQTDSITLEGANARYWIRKMSNTALKLSSRYQDLFPKEESSALIDFLKSGQDFQSVISNQEKGLPILLDLGHINHAVAVVLWGSHFFLFNRTGGEVPTIEAFHYDPKAFDAEVFEKMRRCHKQSKEKYEELYFKELPQTLHFKKELFEENIARLFPLPSQRVGNCSWDSTEAGVWTYLVIKSLVKNGQTELRDTTPTQLSEDFDHIVQKGTAHFHNWLVFNQMYHFERLIGTRFLRPNDDPDKVEKSAAVRKAYPLHRSLVRLALQEIHNQIALINSDIQPQANALFSDLKSHSTGYDDSLLFVLQKNLMLPESEKSDKVEIQLTLNRSGEVLNVAVKADSENNASYIKETVAGLSFPPFDHTLGALQQFTIRFILSA